MEHALNETTAETMAEMNARIAHFDSRYKTIVAEEQEREAKTKSGEEARPRAPRRRRPARRD